MISIVFQQKKKLIFGGSLISNYAGIPGIVFLKHLT